MPFRPKARLSLVRRTFSMAAMLFLVACMSAGCKKKPAPTVPPQATAPEPAPPVVVEAPSAKPAETPKTEPAPPETAAPKPAPKPARRSKPHPPQKPPQKTTTGTEPSPVTPSHSTTAPEGAAASAADASPPNEQVGNKIIVRDGSTSPPPGQISTSVPDSEEARTRRNTEIFLEEAERNIRTLNRTLSGEEQAMLAQVRTFIQQSKSATTDGDAMRANNLAQKAQLLAAELVRKK